MAKTVNTSFLFRATAHKKRPGVISKCKTSRLKNAKHYRKTYRGQGRI